MNTKCYKCNKSYLCKLFDFHTGTNDYGSEHPQGKGIG